MQSKIQNTNIRRINKIPQSFVQSNSTGRLPKWNKKIESGKTKNKLLSNLAVQPILSQPLDLKDDELRQLAKLMVKATRELTGNIDDWDFCNKDSIQELILRCASRITERADVDHIDVFAIEDNQFKLCLKRYIGSRGKVYGIYLKPIYKLKRKNRLLGNILLSFIKSLPYNSIFDNDEGNIAWIWEYFMDELHHCKEEDSKEEYKQRLEGSVNFFRRHKSWYKKIKTNNWLFQLENYHPIKKEYKEIKELLISSVEINFHSPFQITTHDNEFCDLEHSDSFLIIDDDKSDFLHKYIEMLNQLSTECDTTAAFSFSMVEVGKIEKINEHIAFEINKVEDFICDFNELVKKN